MGGGDVAMIMKVDGQATPLSRFTSDGPMLDKIVDGIAASDTPADLPRALGAAADALRDRTNPLIVLVSDGAFPEQQLGLVSWDGAEPAATGREPKNLAAVDLTGIDVRYMPVGKRSDNVGIIAFNVRRYIANKAAYEVLHRGPELRPASRRTASCALYNGDDRRRHPQASTSRPASASARSTRSCPASDDNKLRASLRAGRGPRRQPTRSRSTTRRTRCCPRARSRRS